MITVRDLLDIPRLALSARSLSDERDVWLRWAQAVESTDDISGLVGGELVLTTGRWRRSPADSDRFVCLVRERRAGAIALAAGERETISAELATACERWHMPLIMVPSGTSASEVVEAALALILDRRQVGLLHSLEREQVLTEALSETGICGILAVLARTLGRRVWMLSRGATVAANGEAEPSQEDLRLAVAAVSGTRDAEIEMTLTGGQSATAYAISGAGTGAGTGPRRRGHLICLGGPPESTDDRLAIDQTLAFLALRSDQKQGIRESRRGMAAEFLTRAGSGAAEDEELEAWMRALGIRPEGHTVCVVIQVARDGEDASIELDDYADALEDIADALNGPRVVTVTEGEACAFLFADEQSGGDPSTVIARAETLLEPDLERGGATLGTSSAMAGGIGDVVRLLHDARRVCQFNRLKRPEVEVQSQGLAPASLTTLLLMRDDDACASLQSALLAPLFEYDFEHSSELVHTLDVFLTHGGQWTPAAAQLGVHVNTLRYRLSRIERCTGRDLSAMVNRVDFFVALRTRESVAERGAGYDPTVSPLPVLAD